MKILKITSIIIFCLLFTTPLYLKAGESIPFTSYERIAFGKGWADLDKDCLDTREEILISSSLFGGLEIDGCKVNTMGDFILPYSSFSPFFDINTRSLDVDHVVPLKHAWETGAEFWTQKERIAFANDPENLILSTREDNRRKGSNSPDRWMPPNEDFHCGYLRKWIDIKNKYSLEFNDEEAIFISSELEKKNCNR